MAQQRPELFAAYVGTGQVASWADTVQFQFDFLKQRYAETGDTAALAALDAIGKPDPKNVKQYFRLLAPDPPAHECVGHGLAHRPEGAVQRQRRDRGDAQGDRRRNERVGLGVD